MDCYKILDNFILDGTAVSCRGYGCGHINSTFLAATDKGYRYILQKINHDVFKNVDELMENIISVTEHLRRKNKDPRAVMQFAPAADGRAYYYDKEEDSYWRVSKFVENSISLQKAECLEDFRQSAIAFGRFQEQLKDFPAETLHESIPNFHNTPDRYRILKETIAADPVNRAAAVQNEIEFALNREYEAGEIIKLLQNGELPLRVTHNDTKLNNVLLDATTRKALCVIDLDTIMPGSSLYDYGDSIRFGAASAAEDERDLSKMELSLPLFETYTAAYTEACPDLTDRELLLMPAGAKLMTMENGIRFLTDYLDGDHYYAVHREGQNLDRARAQFKLASDMEKKWEQMHRIVDKYRAH